jgi:hypothetical protein
VKTFHAVLAGGIEIEDDAGVRRSVPVDELDQRFTTVVGLALRRSVPAALVVPLAGGTAVIAAAVAAATRLLLVRRNPEVRIVIVSTRIGLRSTLDRTWLGDQRLTETLPRCVLTSSGDLRPIGRPREELTGWITFTSAVEHAEGVQPDVIVVDGDGRRVELEVITRVASKSALLYITSSPFDPALATIEAYGGAVVAFDRGDFAAWSGGITGLVAPGWVSRAARSGMHELVGPSSSQFDDALSNLWHALTLAQGRVERSEDLAFGWGTAGALGQLAAPIEEHDRAARLDPWAQPLSSSLSRLHSFAQNASGATREALHSVADSIEAVLKSAPASNPKPMALARLVREEVAAGRGFVIVARSRAACACTSAHLDETPGVPLGWATLGRVVTAKRLLLEGPRPREQTVIATGPVSRPYTGLIPVPAAGRLVVLVAGAWERSKARRQIEQASLFVTSLARTESAQASALRLGFELTDTEPVEPKIEDREWGEVGSRPVRHGHIWDPFAVEIVGHLGDREPDLEARATHEDERTVMAITLQTLDGTIFVEPDRLISRIREGEEREVAAKSVQTDDRVVLVDTTARASLFALVAARAQEVPELQPVVLLVDDWHLRAGLAPGRSRMTHPEILRGMTGTSVTSPSTIGTWIRSEVHGPEDPDDIVRFAGAVGDDVLLRRARAMAQAIETLRRYRRRLGGLLSESIRTGKGEGWLDARLGIHFSDVASVLSTHIVTTVDHDLRSVPASMAGRLQVDRDS